MHHNMGALLDNSDILKCVYHTRKIYINIFRNLEKQLTTKYFQDLLTSKILML